MILEVSALTATEESALLDPIAPLQDDDVSKKLLDDPSVTLESSDDRVHEELDSSTALLSVFSGPELLASSPQATNSATAAIRAIFTRYLLKGFAII